MIEVTAFAGGLLLLLTAVTWIGDRLLDRSVASGTPARVERHIPADEMALTGTDYRDRVRPYFQKRWESQVRTRAAVNHVCGLDRSER